MPRRGQDDPLDISDIRIAARELEQLREALLEQLAEAGEAGLLFEQDALILEHAATLLRRLGGLGVYTGYLKDED